MQVSDDTRVGTELAGYRIDSLLGFGGMSVVYLAEDLRLKRRVALKLLAASLAEDESFRDRFLRESELAASIDHPNIVPIYEAGTTEDLLYIAMRYVEGGDLKDRLQRGRLDPADAIGILAQVASALDAAHARGLVHRDVKPSNVLLDPGARPDGSDHVYLADFGLTTRVSEEAGIGDDGHLMGTIDYVAPSRSPVRRSTGEPTSTRPVSPAIAFTPDGRRLVASSGPAGTVRVWNVKTGAELLVIHAEARGHAQARGVIGIDVSPDGSRIATAGADGSARVYDAKSGEELLAVRGRHCVGEGSCAVNRAAFSPDGTKIATTGSDATVRIIAADTGRELRVLRGGGPVGSGTYSVEWSKDGRRLLAFGKNGARVWEVESGRSLVRTEEAPGPGVAAAWSPDETQILTEGGSGPLVWDAATGRMVRTVAAGAPIEDIAFSRDGTRLALTTVDPSRSTQVWDWPRDVELLKLTDGAKRAAFSPDGKLLAGVRSEPTPYVHVWALDIDRLLEIARGRVTRSLTAAECRQYLQGPCP